MESTAPALPDNRIDPKVWRVVAVVFLGPFMSQMDSTVVNVSLAAIRDDLHATLSSAQWIISGYLLALALMLPLNGWLVDRIGAKRLYLICFSGFTAASLLCGASHTIDALILARILQGMAGGLLAPMTQMMVARVAGKQMARVIGFAAVPILLAPLLGPVIAGAILKYASWPWLFYINLPVGIFAVGLAAYLLPKDTDEIQRRPFDLLGFAMISPALACLLYGFEQATHRDGGLILFAGFLLMGLFFAHARRKKSAALIDLSLFENRTFTTAIGIQFLINGAIYAGQFLIPLYLITGCGISPAQSGWMLAPMGLGMMVTYPLMGYLTDKFGCRAVSLSGALLTLAGTVPFLWMIEYGFSPVLLMICLIARGAGQGATGIPAISAAYSSVPKERLGIATTAFNIFQRLGGPVATTSLAIIMSKSGAATANDPQVFMWPFLAVVIMQFVLSLAVTRLPKRI